MPAALLLGLALAVQATPEGVAARDADELTRALAGVWNSAETAYFAAELDAYPVHDASFVVRTKGDEVVVSADGSSPPEERWRLRSDPHGLVLVSLDQPSCAVSIERQADVFLIGDPQDGSDEHGPCVFAGGRGAVLTEDALSLHHGEGGPVAYRRADPYTCWVSRRKDTEGWTWTPDLTVREGEYVQLPDEEGASRPVGIRLRHVRWPYGPNRDSLVLYVHEAEDEPAASYAWTEPDAARIAVNLRWVQASCTRDEG